MKKSSPFRGVKKSLSRMRRTLSEAGGSLQKSVSRLGRPRPSHRHAESQRKQADREVLNQRRLMAAAKRRHRARKAVSERREAVSQFLRTGLRVEAVRAALGRAQQSPFTRRWVPRMVAMVAVLSLTGNLLQYARYSPWRPLVTVGHRVVRQREYMAMVDSAAGKAVLNKVVYDELIQQAATKADLLPSAQDVASRITELRRRSPGALPPDDQLWDQVRLKLALENLRMRGATATDAEVAVFYAQHKDLFTAPARTSTTLVVTADAAAAARAARMLSAGQPETVVAAEPGMHVAGVGGYNVNLDALPPAVRQQVGQTVVSLPLGAVKTLRVGKSVFFTLKPQQREPGQVSPLPAVREEVARLVRLQKSPSDQVELAQLYRTTPPSFDMAKYAHFVDVPSAAPSDSKTASLPPADAP